MMKGGTMCHVCEVQPHKYKCPKCRQVRYCSVACFRTHKVSCCGGETLATGSVTSSPAAGGGAATAPEVRRADLAPTGSVGGGSAVDDVDDADCAFKRIGAEHRKRLDESEEVRQALQSGDLRMVINRILGSQDCGRALREELETNSRFRTFADQSLLAAGLATAAGGASNGVLFDFAS